jgi:hypothetical protein
MPQDKLTRSELACGALATGAALLAGCSSLGAPAEEVEATAMSEEERERHREEVADAEARDDGLVRAARHQTCTGRRHG